MILRFSQKKKKRERKEAQVKGLISQNVFTPIHRGLCVRESDKKHNSIVRYNNRLVAMIMEKPRYLIRLMGTIEIKSIEMIPQR